MLRNISTEHCLSFNSQSSSSLQLSFRHSESSSTYLKQEKLDNGVLQFSKLKKSKRLQSKHKRFNTSLLVEGESGKGNIFSQNLSAKFQKRTGFTPYKIIEEQFEDIDEKYRMQESSSLFLASNDFSLQNGSGKFQSMLQGKSTANTQWTTNARDEIQEGSNLQIISQPLSQIDYQQSVYLPNNNKRFSEQTLFSVMDINESFEVKGNDYDHSRDDNIGSSHKIILEQSMITANCTELKDQLDNYLKKRVICSQNRKKISQIQPKQNLSNILELDMSWSREEEARFVRVHGESVVFDKISKFIMEEKIVTGYFSNGAGDFSAGTGCFSNGDFSNGCFSNGCFGAGQFNNSNSNSNSNHDISLYWPCLLSGHSSIQSVYGIEKQANNLLIYREYIPHPKMTLRQLIDSHATDVKQIPSIIKQILSFICEMRKHDCLHGCLIPDNIICSGSSYRVLIDDFSACLKFKDTSNKLSSQKNYYPGFYDRFQFLFPDLWAVAMLTYELYTEQLLFHQNFSVKKIERPEIPALAVDFIETISASKWNKNKNIEAILSHPFIWESQSHDFLFNI